MTERRFELLIFDWDGTLIDSAMHIMASVQAAAASAELPIPSAAAARNIIGLGFAEACKTLYPEAEPAAYQQMETAFLEHFSSAATTATRLFAGTPAVLEELARQGYLLAIATGNSSTGLRTALAETGLTHLIDSSRCADQAPSKPHPQMILEILDELSVAKEHALMIGDTEYDLAMAQNAGISALAASYGTHDVERLLAYQPLACLDDIRELPAVLATLPASSA